VLTWLVFILMFVIEPLFLDRWLARAAASDSLHPVRLAWPA
jgi:hypothetical protein